MTFAWNPLRGTITLQSHGGEVWNDGEISNISLRSLGKISYGGGADATLTQQLVEQQRRQPVRPAYETAHSLLNAFSSAAPARPGPAAAAAGRRQLIGLLASCRSRVPPAELSWTGERTLAMEKKRGGGGAAVAAAAIARVERALVCITE